MWMTQEQADDLMNDDSGEDLSESEVAAIQAFFGKVLPEKPTTAFDDSDGDLISDLADALADGKTLTVNQAAVLNRRIEDLSQNKLYGQWARHPTGAFYTVGETTPILPPGVYSPVVVQGQLFFSPVRMKTDHLLRFPDTMTDEIVKEISDFWDRRAAFQQYGMSFKRGILMYGPPGSGKTSTLQLISRQVVDMGGVCLVFDFAGVFLIAYRALRSVQPDVPVVVLMEDVDSILERQNQSNVLNILDGVEEVDRIVFVATTNFAEKLLERVYNRPSRFDRRIFVGHPTAAGRKMYLDYLVGHGDPIEDIDRYIKDTEGMSMAHLKELFVSTVILGAEYAKTVKQLRVMNEEKPSSAFDQEASGGVPIPRGGNFL